MSGSAKRFGVLGAVMLAGVLIGVTACGSDATNDAGPTGETETDRQASLLANKMRVCVENSSSAPIALEWNSYMQNGKSEYLNSRDLKKSLAPGASDCAVSYAWAGVEDAKYRIEDMPQVIQNIGVFRVSIIERVFDRLDSDTEVRRTLNSGITEGRSLDIRATTTGDLIQYDQIQVYPIDIQVSDAQ